MSGGHAGGDRLSALLAFDLEIDTRGLMCPLPLLRLKKALQTLEGGQVVRVLATDPASVLDFGVFVEQTGHALLDWREETGVFIYLIRKG
ncbi:sulfurtransferase TusA [Methyloparacoccus murrellii]|jgi:tRNA 2-thiouridine synthesizing protein A